MFSDVIEEGSDVIVAGLVTSYSRGVSGVIEEKLVTS